MKPNRAEASALFGRPIETLADAQHAIGEMAAIGVTVPLLSLGADGALLRSVDDVLHARVDIDSAINPVGSGDCLLGGIAVGLMRGESPEAALRLGIACGAANAASIETGWAPRAEIEALLLEELLKRDDVLVTAICDVDPQCLDGALKQFADNKLPKPLVFSGSDHAYEVMLAKAKLDAVLIVTPWEWHAPMAIAAMQAKVPIGCEVVAGITLDDHWNLLKTQLQTGTPYMLLENVCYRRDVMAVMNMVRQGLFGELVHLQAGYQHDLRKVNFNNGVPGKFDGGVEFGAKAWSEARWRTAHAVNRNGELYPSHGIGPCAMNLNIHRGNRFTRLNSFASKARGLHEYINGQAPDHPNTRITFKLGDVVTTQLSCANGETVLLQHDTSLPRPYSLGFRVQGTHGLWMDVNESIYIEGQSKNPHQWETAQPWLDKYDHPLWKKYAEAAKDAGHGGMDFFVVHAFIEALKAKAPMPIDIYDAVAWSAITPLSEQSIAQGNATVDFPDFTAGAWATRKPIFALDDRY